MRIKNDNFFLKSPFFKGDVRPCLPAGGRTGGFAYTLFELLVSISIIAVLVAVATASYSGAQKKARDSRRIEDLNSIQKAAEMYYSQKGYDYPANTEDFKSSGVLQTWPSDPKNGPYVPNQLTETGYCVCALLDSPTAGNSNATCGFGSATTHYCVKNQQ